jgi:hypothetical protein
MRISKTSSEMGLGKYFVMIIESAVAIGLESQKARPERYKNSLVPGH